jgi:hypothetical protein
VLSARLAECERALPAWTEERAHHWWSAHAPAAPAAT